jgi:mannose-6-phosphate isomerase-like protein (cupin superfamily)
MQRVMRMRTVAITIVLTSLASLAGAQTPSPTPTDRTKATHFSGADLRAALAKLPADRPASSVRVFTLDPYNVAVEQRQPMPQGASLHEAQAELFYVIDGSATMVTGGALVAGKRNGTNVQGTGIEGGTRIVFTSGDFIMVPSGVPHQFVDIKSPVRVMSMYLANPK